MMVELVTDPELEAMSSVLGKLSALEKKRCRRGYRNVSVRLALQKATNTARG
jgi:hypothetical protein